MSSALGQLIDESRVDQITWDSIPAPPHAKVQGNHLFVNVRYGSRFSDSSADVFLAEAEVDAVAIIENALKSGVVTGNESICISFFLDEGRMRGRALRISVMKAELESFVSGTQRLSGSKVMATSEVNEIEEALGH